MEGIRNKQTACFHSHSKANKGHTNKQQVFKTFDSHFRPNKRPTNKQTNKFLTFDSPPKEDSGSEAVELGSR